LRRYFLGCASPQCRTPLEAVFPRIARNGGFDDIVLLGALGPHKGSAKLLELAQRARLHRPTLRLHVIGYTDIDRQLKAVGNVRITGRYEAAELSRLLAASRAKVALFLHGWPETFSYTLTEAVMHGLIPLVPDIGAPSERVRAAGLGVVFPFPIDCLRLLQMIDDLDSGRLASATQAGSPAALCRIPSARLATCSALQIRSSSPQQQLARSHGSLRRIALS
jgi:glycosyltransferase involved in cell wall biosynthesis